MRINSLKLSSIAAVILILASGLILWQNQAAYAKKQETKEKISAETRMEKYSVKTSQDPDKNIRRSRLSEINVLSEAAVILNVLPIDIMEEMKGGKNLEDIAKEKGYPKGKFLKKLTELDTKNIDEALRLGTISKEHGAALKDGQKDRLNHNLMMESVDVNDHKAMDMNH